MLATEIDITPILRKPVVYGSELANLTFIIVTTFHAIVSGVAVISGTAAIALPKRGKWHLLAGKLFIITLITSVVSGFGLDMVRLLVSTQANDVKYPGASMPSTYPARFAFTYAALCILYMVHQTTPLSVAKPSKIPWVALSLVAIGLGITALIITRYNPWTGALWMIWSFTAATGIVAYLKQQSSKKYEARVHLHRFTMLFLIAFTWWAAWTSYRHGINYWLFGFQDSGGSYLGNQPGEYSHSFISFIKLWIRPFALGGLIWLYFVVRRRIKQSTSRQLIQK